MIILTLSFICFCFIFFLLNQYKNKNYWTQIKQNSKIKDWTKWILSDKFIAKQYAKLYGFNIPETFQLVKYPHQIDFSKLHKNFVIKPTDLSDSQGVFLIKNKKNIKPEKIIKKLYKLQSNIDPDRYYMHHHMFNGLIPYNGIIVEKLLLDENKNIPCDYKCYVFNGRIHFIAMTYNRHFINGQQKFNSLWFTRDWKPIRIPMIKKNYKYSNNIKKPKAYNKMIKLVENISKKLKRHCRIDVYLIKKKVYLGEFTFFGGAFIHSHYCNFKLGKLWNKYKDNIDYHDPELKKIVPSYYINPL